MKLKRREDVTRPLYSSAIEQNAGALVHVACIRTVWRECGVSFGSFVYARV